MLERNKQEVSNVSDSFVQQANGNINNYGMGYNDVKDICRDVVRQELAIVTKEATDIFHQEISAFENQFIDRLEKLENPQVIDKLKTPKLQFVLHDTMKEYAQTDDQNTKDELIDLLIERLNNDENITIQFVIDEAIKVLPKITKEAAYLLGALLTRNITIGGTLFHLDNSLSEQAKVYSSLDSISILDLEYLMQQKCCTLLPNLQEHYKVLEAMGKRYNLFFRHAVDQQTYNMFIEKNPAWSPEKSVRNYFFSKDGNYKIIPTHKSFLLESAKRDHKEKELPALENFVESMTPWSEEEIHSYLVNLNPDWQKAINVLDRNEFRPIQLTPVGTYIANRIITRVIGCNYTFQDFYKSN